ncbi:MAG: response regulator [Pirellulales bacterium]
MPELDGIELLASAKKRNAWTQAIFLTAHSSWARIADAIEHGASDYLTKPLDVGNLLALLGETIKRMERWENALRSASQPSERRAVVFN